MKTTSKFLELLVVINTWRTDDSFKLLGIDRHTSKVIFLQTYVTYYEIFCLPKPIIMNNSRKYTFNCHQAIFLTIPQLPTHRHANPLGCVDDITYTKAHIVKIDCGKLLIICISGNCRRHVPVMNPYL